jgi:hypothetical protein
MDHGSSWLTMDQGHGHGGEPVKDPAPSRFWHWGPDAHWGKVKGCYTGLVSRITKAWEVARRWRTGYGVSTRKRDGVGAVGNRSRRVGGVGSFTEGGAAFYRAEARQGARVPSVAGVEGASMSRLEGVGYWRSEQVRVSFNGEMKEGQRGEFSPSAEVAMGATRGQTATEDAGSILVWEEEESRLGQASQKAEWAGWAENQEGNSF